MSWDDGKHTKVKKIHLTFDDVINSIEVEYDGTSLKSQPRGTIGTKSDGFTLSPDEYITEVNGYYKTVFSGDVITALAFKTNKKTYGPYGNKTRNYFSVNAPNSNQIAGFLGTSGNALNSIDVHFAPIPLAGSTGINPGGTTPGGAGTTPGGAGTTPGGTTPGSAGTTPGGAGTTPGGAGTTPGGAGTTPGGAGTTPGGAGTTPGGTTPGSAGTTPGGAGTTPGGAGTTPGGAGTTPGGAGTTPGGTTPGGAGTTPGGAGTTPEGAGTTPGGAGTTPGGAGTTPGSAGTTPGGAGTTPEGAGTTPGTNPGSAGTTPGGAGTTPGGGAGTTPGATPGGSGTTPGGHGTTPGGGAGSNNNSNSQKLEVQGGKGGNQWDDGANHDGVTKIHIVPGGLGIEQIKFDYFKNGETKEGAFHGVRQRGSISTIEINHPNEYLVSVKGWFDSTNIIQGIQFITNTKTSDTFGYGDGEEFSLEVKDKKIIGFHGFADSHLNSLGAYFTPITSTPLIPAKKLKAIGGDEGDLWDDGVFDGVRKVHVGQYHDGVSFVKIEYNKGSQEIEGDGHGKESMLGVETFALDYPSEYITALQGYYDNVQGEKGALKLVTSLIFVTNKQKSYPYGITGGEFFEIKEEGHKIVGFHGKAGDWVHQIGVYVAPITN